MTGVTSHEIASDKKTIFGVGFLDVFYVEGTCQTPDGLPKYLRVLRRKLPVKTILPTLHLNYLKIVINHPICPVLA